MLSTKPLELGRKHGPHVLLYCENVSRLQAELRQVDATAVLAHRSRVASWLPRPATGTRPGQRVPSRAGSATRAERSCSSRAARSSSTSASVTAPSTRSSSRRGGPGAGAARGQRAACAGADAGRGGRAGAARGGAARAAAARARSGGRTGGTGPARAGWEGRRGVRPP